MRYIFVCNSEALLALIGVLPEYGVVDTERSRAHCQSSRGFRVGEVGDNHSTPPHFTIAIFCFLLFPLTLLFVPLRTCLVYLILYRIATLQHFALLSRVGRTSEIAGVSGATRTEE